MKTELRLAAPSDLAAIMATIDEAKGFLKAQGIDQWQHGYPDEAVIREDMEKSQGYVLVVTPADTEQDKQAIGRVEGYAAVIPGEEPAYTIITDGAWTNDSLDYVTIHRTAISNRYRGQGLGAQMFRLAFQMMEARGYHDFRVDTHPLNPLMQHLIEKVGFKPRGMVWIESERIAYQLETPRD